MWHKQTFVANFQKINLKISNFFFNILTAPGAYTDCISIHKYSSMYVCTCA